MSSRRIVLMDVLGTLVHDPFYVEVPAFFEMSLEELLAVKHPTAWIDFETGSMDEETFLARFFHDGRAYDHAGLMRCMAEAYRWLDGMEELLAGLAGAGLEIHALSNYSPWYRWIEDRLALSRYLSWSFVSCDTGVRKPDERAFTGPVETLLARPPECLFVDDREVNCLAAARCGIDAVRFQDAADLRPRLSARGLLPDRGTG